MRALSIWLDARYKQRFSIGGRGTFQFTAELHPLPLSFHRQLELLGCSEQAQKLMDLPKDEEHLKQLAPERRIGTPVFSREQSAGALPRPVAIVVDAASEAMLLAHGVNATSIRNVEMLAGLVGALAEAEPLGAIEGQRDATERLTACAVAPQFHRFHRLFGAGGSRNAAEAPDKPREMRRLQKKSQHLARRWPPVNKELRMVEVNRNSTAPPAVLEGSALQALRTAESSWRERFGGGSRRELRRAYGIVLTADAPGAAYGALRETVEREHRSRYGLRRLALELSDERERDAARSSDAALVAYERKWGHRLAKLQRVHPARWNVPGLSAEELRDELTLRLIDTLRTAPAELEQYERAGREWALSFFSGQRAQLRKAFRIDVAPADISCVCERVDDQEERLIAHQSAELLGLARSRAERSLSRPQRRWFAAMKMSANAGSFFEASGKLNLAAVSRLLDKNRSSALRAFRELEQHFTRELAKLEP
ncbi:MAG: hypothetical protein ACOY0T_16745 [Myxococcota bacterium]